MSSKNIVYFDTNFKKKKKKLKTSLLNNPDKSIPWVEKYRPHHVNNIICKILLKKLNRLLKRKISNLIITGCPGTGKTSTILCIAKRNC